MSAVLLAIKTVTLFWGCQQATVLKEGVYTTCEELAPYYTEILILRDGKASLRRESDVGSDGKNAFVHGTYSVEGNALLLNVEGADPKRRILETINGVSVLWREKDRQDWVQNREMSLWGLLLYASDDPAKVRRPSIYSLRKGEGLLSKEDALRFKNYDDSIRDLFIAENVRGDVDHKEFQKALKKARKQLSYRMVAALTELSKGPGEDSGTARIALAGLYLRVPEILDETPEFLQSPIEKAAAISHLVEAITLVSNKEGLEILLGILIRVLGRLQIKLLLDDCGVEVNVSAADGVVTKQSKLMISPNAPQKEDWSDKMSSIRTACHKACLSYAAEK